MHLLLHIMGVGQAHKPNPRHGRKEYPSKVTSDMEVDMARQGLHDGHRPKIGENASNVKDEIWLGAEANAHNIGIPG
jgi:hypothetical protein